MHLQPVVQSPQTVHATQIQPGVQPAATQVMVVHPSNQVQYQLHMSQGWTNPRLNTAQMAMTRQAWKSDKKVNGDRSGWNQEKVRLQQQYQLLYSEYQAALVQIQTLNLQHNELDRKLKIDQWKYQELNNKYMIGIQIEQNKYKALEKVHNETCIQLRNEKGKCNALNIKLEESSKKLMNEQEKFKVLTRIHAESKKILHNARQKREEVANVVDSKSKSINIKQIDAGTVILEEQPGESTLNGPVLDRGNVTSQTSRTTTHDSMQVNEAIALSERSNNLVVPPGFGGSTQISSQASGTME